MGYGKLIQLHCDTCEEPFFDGPIIAETVAAARKEARESGWSYSHKYGDRCPDCRSNTDTEPDT